MNFSDIKPVVHLWWRCKMDGTLFDEALLSTPYRTPQEVLRALATGFGASPVEKIILALWLLNDVGCCTRQGCRQIRDALLGS